MWDANGNLVQFGEDVFKYDAFNRLVEANGVRYLYDAQNRRVAKIFPDGSRIYYVYHGWTCIAEYDENGTLLREYVEGISTDEHLMIVDYTSDPGGERYYYVLDHLNGVDKILDETGEIVEEYEYSAYGEILSGNVGEESVTGNCYTFQGRRYDSESNLMYFRNRMYSPEMKRFVSMDPLGFVDSMNLYETFGCDPVNIIDRFGLSEPYSLGYEMARIRILEIEKGLYRGGYASPIFVSKLKDVPKELLGGLLPKYVAVRIGPVSRGKVSIINAWLEPWGNKGKGEIFGKIAEALKKINEVSEKVDLIEKYISLMKNAFTWSAAKTPWVRLRITGRIKYKKYIWNRLMRGKEKWTRAGIFSRIEMKEKIQPVDDAGLGIMILANPLEWEVFRGKIQNLLDQTWGDFSESKFLPLEKGDPSFY